MAPLIVLLVTWLVLRIFGIAGVALLDSFTECLRFALAAMFIFTGFAHFSRTRADLVRMVPPRLAHPEFWVSMTGVLEFAGAAGLLIPAFTRLAALCLIVLLALLLPANFHATQAGVTVAGRKAMPLPLRVAVQLFWIAALAWIARTSHPGVLGMSGLW